MCVCISLSAYVTLACLFSPKISIIILHPSKNVKRLTMNSANYKRAFKPVSSVASVEGGRNNLQPGGSVAQPEAPSAGPMSTTSNALNLGESGRGEQVARGYKSFGCFLYDCQFTGFAQCIRSLWRMARSFSALACWRSANNWIGQCCSLGDLGPRTAYELDASDCTELQLQGRRAPD